MGESLEGAGKEPYRAVYMKAKLQVHFGDKIVITSIQGKYSVVTFKETVASVIHDFTVIPESMTIKRRERELLRPP